MRILHSGTLDVNAGGPAMSTYLTLKGLNDIGVDAELIMFPLIAKGHLRGTDIPIHYASKLWGNFFLYSPSFKRQVISLGNFDIYHAQGIWQYPTYAIVDIARKRHTPYLITPRGMLYPQDIHKSNYWLKEFSLKFRLLDDLNRAACVHVTCEAEMNYCRELGVTSPIAIIPNPVDSKAYKPQKYDGTFRLGYLGRLSPRKNVESLIYSFAELGHLQKNSELWIIGGGDVKYEEFLKKEVSRLNLKGVYFTGFLNGINKDNVLSKISVLVMPSEFENLGNVILEGLIRGIPCIATKGAPWQDLETFKCGWWIPFKQECLNQVVRQVVQMNSDILRSMGEAGKQMVKEKYSVNRVANMMKITYDWILNQGLAPEFLYER
jgi:glycosyltransferase involved in cell wall biosynthesis